jgi:hypothetical protein
MNGDYSFCVEISIPTQKKEYENYPTNRDFFFHSNSRYIMSLGLDVFPLSLDLCKPIIEEATLTVFVNLLNIQRLDQTTKTVQYEVEMIEGRSYAFKIITSNSSLVKPLDLKIYPVNNLPLFAPARYLDNRVDHATIIHEAKTSGLHVIKISLYKEETGAVTLLNVEMKKLAHILSVDCQIRVSDGADGTTVKSVSDLTSLDQIYYPTIGEFGNILAFGNYSDCQIDSIQMICGEDLNVSRKVIILDRDLPVEVDGMIIYLHSMPLPV